MDTKLLEQKVKLAYNRFDFPSSEIKIQPGSDVEGKYLEDTIDVHWRRGPSHYFFLLDPFTLDFSD